MLLRPFLRLIKNNQLAALASASTLFKPFYELTYLAATKRNGLLDLLSAKPLPFEQIADVYCRSAKAREALGAWLQLGVRLKLLKLTEAGYSLKGLACRLYRPENDATLALLEEVATLHHKLVLYTPDKLKRDQLWSLDDQNGELTTRSSRTLEAFQIEAIDASLPSSGQLRLLEIGCGSALYMKHAASRNPALNALGWELQPDVAELARADIERWGLQARCEVRVGDSDLRGRHQAHSRGLPSQRLAERVQAVSVTDRDGVFRPSVDPGERRQGSTLPTGEIDR